MSSPLVSIIVPFFNTGNSAKKLIHDILNQSYRNLQIVFINDGSTDNTPKLLKNAQKQDKRIVLIDQKNSGSAASARNSGLAKATGQYVMFCDSDDEIDSKFAEKMLAKIRQAHSDLVTCGFKYHRLSDNSTTTVFTNPVADRRPSENLPAYVVRLLGNDGHLFSVVNKIFRTDLIKKHRLTFDSKLDFGEDLVFVLNYLKHAQKIDFLYEPLYTYHYGTSTSTVSVSSLKYENWQQNWQFLTSWFHPKNQVETDHLNWVNYRYGYSYCLAVCRSSQKHRQKRALISKAAKNKKLPQVGKLKHIGRKKYLLERLYRLASKTTFTLFALSALLVKIKKANPASGSL